MRSYKVYMRWTYVKPFCKGSTLGNEMTNRPRESPGIHSKNITKCAVCYVSLIICWAENDTPYFG